MASTNFKLFDENKTNMMSDTEYNINTQRLNGVQSGIASSQLQNKTLYQTSLMSYALAQLMNQNGIDSNDTAAVSAFVNGLSDTLVQKVLDKATEQMAIAGTDNSHYMTPALVKKSVEEGSLYKTIIDKTIDVPSSGSYDELFSKNFFAQYKEVQIEAFCNKPQGSIQLMFYERISETNIIKIELRTSIALGNSVVAESKDHVNLSYYNQPDNGLINHTILKFSSNTVYNLIAAEYSTSSGDFGLFTIASGFDKIFKFTGLPTGYKFRLIVKAIPYDEITF